MSVFTCGVAWSSICPVLARRVFNNVRSVAFSTYNKDFLTKLKDLSLIEPTQGNRNGWDLKNRGTKRVRNEKGKSDPTPQTPFRYDGEQERRENERRTDRKNQFDNTEQEGQAAICGDKQTFPRQACHSRQMMSHWANKWQIFFLILTRSRCGLTPRTTGALWPGCSARIASQSFRQVSLKCDQCCFRMCDR